MIPVRIRAAPSDYYHHPIVDVIHMASKKTQYGSVKRYGTRYGRTLKNKAGKVEDMQRQEYVCPQCHYKKVKRVVKGVWNCEKCGAKFASKAYSVAKLPSLKAEQQA